MYINTDVCLVFETFAEKTEIVLIETESLE